MNAQRMGGPRKPSRRPPGSGSMNTRPSVPKSASQRAGPRTEGSRVVIAAPADDEPGTRTTRGGDWFGTARVARVARAFYGEMPAAIIKGVLAAAEMHALGEPAGDDVTLFCVLSRAHHDAHPARRPYAVSRSSTSRVL